MKRLTNYSLWTLHSGADAQCQCARQLLLYQLARRLSPQEIGKKVAEHFVLSPHQYTATIHYSEVATWYGALTLLSHPR